MNFSKLIILAFSVLLFSFIPAAAQIGYYSDKDTTSKKGIEDFEKNSPLFKNKRLGFSMEMGAGVSGSKYGIGSYTYFSPFLNYRVSPRFRLDFGASYIQGFNNFKTNDLYGFGSNQSYLSLFARGNYLVSDKLLISGTVYKTFDLTKPQNSDLNNQKRSLENYGIIVGAEYKITENLTIGAQVNFSDRNSGYYNNPFYPCGFSNGLQQDANSFYPNGFGHQTGRLGCW